MWLSIIAISAGAALGANLRWLLGTWLNALYPAIPPGTLVANWFGAWLIGLALAYFSHLPHLSPEWRLFIITGFLGALTTFSTFSAETLTNLQSGRWGMALAGVAIHVIGSIALTALGMATFVLLRNLSGAVK